MKITAMIMFFLLSFTLLLGTPLIDNLRFSAPTSDEQIITRGELGFYYDVSFYYNGDNGWVYQTFDAIEDSYNSFQSSLPAPIDDTLKIGIRAYNDVISETDAGVAIQAIPWVSQAMPLFNDLNWLVNDTTEDTTLDETFLDITATYFTFNDEKLYFSIQNNGGGFPVSEAIWGPFYSYISLIIPTDINLTPFGLLYTVNQAGIIQPGLYKIVGTGMNDIQLIGSIESTIDATNNLLTLSCNWSDLYADDDFNAWFDPEEPMFSTVSGTGRITLAGGMQETDFTYPAVVFLDSITLDPLDNALPQITDPHADSEAGLVYATYLDENGNFPLTAQALINGEISVELQAQSYDFSQEVVFVSNQVDEILNADWTDITVIFSDNNIDYTEMTIYPVSNLDSDVAPVLTSFTNYPNPFNPETTISFTLHEGSQVKLEIYNLKGQKLVTLLEGLYPAGKQEVKWAGKDQNNKDVASGIYYVLLKTESEKHTHKMVLMK